MKKIVLGILAVLAVGVLGVLAIAAMRPAHYRIARSATVTAKPATLYALVNDQHNFPRWSPWQKLDPAMKITYGGGAAGVGSTYRWVGNKEAGEGQMTITSNTPDQLVGMKLEFIKPFASTASTNLTFAPEGGGTKVEWSMEGDNDLMGKVMCLFMDMDKMVGKDFTEGLANLGSVGGKADSVAAAAAVTAAAAAAPADSAAAPAGSATATH